MKQVGALLLSLNLLNWEPIQLLHRFSIIQYSFGKSRGKHSKCTSSTYKTGSHQTMSNKKMEYSVCPERGTIDKENNVKQFIDAIKTNALLNCVFTWLP